MNKILTLTITPIFSVIFGIKLLEAMLLGLKSIEIQFRFNTDVSLLAAILIFSYGGFILGWHWIDVIKLRYLMTMIFISGLILINDFYYNVFWRLFEIIKL
jgi:hypothetical protein